MLEMCSTNLQCTNLKQPNPSGNVQASQHINHWNNNNSRYRQHMPFGRDR